MDTEFLREIRLCIIGYSGHAFVVIETLRAQGFVVTAYCDHHSKNFNPYGLQYLGSEKDANVLEQLNTGNFRFFPAVGNNRLRKAIFEDLSEKMIKTVVAKHPSAIISPGAGIGEGSLVASGAIVQARAQVGAAVICNSGSIIEHECVVGDFSHIAPGAVLCGNVHIGKESLVGAGAVVNPGIKIGANVIIGSGAVVTRDVPDGSVVAGNPARELKVKI